MKNYNELPMYVRSVNKRDQILERLLMKSRARQSDELRHFINLVFMHVTRLYPLMNKEHLDPSTITSMKRLEWEIEQSAAKVSHLIFVNWNNLRRWTFAFSWAATQRSLLNAGLKGKPQMLPAGKLAHHTGRKTELGSMTDRIHLALERLKRKVIDAVQMSRILGESLEETLARVGRAFPPGKRQKKINVLTRAMLENATTEPGPEPIYGPMFIDADDWDSIVAEYNSDYRPEWRDPRYGTEISIPVGDEDEYMLYPWQIEREMIEDFVSSVRAGEVDSMNAQGITDFVWIAVLDSHTDDCCRKRDGLTNSEIEAKLKMEWSDDDCDSAVPPAHFNCRCRLAPATENLPKKPASNAEDIGEWLNS
jgi:SPP1 gp7 family putative phage head morphogenesis protein